MKSSLGKVLIGGLTLFQAGAIYHDLSAARKVQGDTSVSDDKQKSWSALAIAACDGYNSVLEFNKSPFISIDNAISAALGLVAFSVPGLKKLTNDIHAIQILKYSGYSVRNKPNAPNIDKKQGFFQKFGLEAKHSLSNAKNLLLKLPKINHWGSKFLQSPVKYFHQNSHNFFILKAIGELIAGTLIIGSDIALFNLNKRKENIEDNKLITNDDELIRKEQKLESINNRSWLIVKVLYFINAAAWLSRAFQPGRAVGTRLSEGGLGIAKGIHAAFANNPTLAFASRALERFFYLTTSYLFKKK